MTSTRTDGRDQGSVSAYLVVVAVAMLGLAGLVLDGGAVLAARGHAHSVAEQAARAGANAISADSLRAATPAWLVIDPGAARAAAMRILESEHMTGEISIDGTTVTVHAHATGRTTILSLVGINHLTATGTATAQALPGLAGG